MTPAERLARFVEAWERGSNAPFEPADVRAVLALLANRAAPPDPLAELTTRIHPDEGDGPYIQLSARVAVPRGEAGKLARVVVLPDVGEGDG